MNFTALLTLLQNPKMLGTLMQVPQALQMVQTGPKPGQSTTEFWLTTGVSLYLMFAPAVPTEIAAVAVPVLVGVYTFARAIVKGLHGAGKAQNVNIPELTADQKKALGIDDVTAS